MTLATPARDPRRWRVLAVLSVMQFLIVSDNTIVNVALPAIRTDLNFTNGGLAWVVDGYVLAAGGLLLLCGRIGDRVGHRRMFLAGTFVFGVSSLCSAVSLEPVMLVLSRFGQGVGEALAAPAALALIASLFIGNERTKALGIWGGLAGTGATVGVLLSGVLVQWAGWRWIFLINIPFVVLAMTAAPRLLRADLPSGRRAPLDVVGAVLVTAGLTLGVAALLNTARHGWTAPSTCSFAAGAVGCLAAFVIVEHRVATHPLIPLSYLRHGTRTGANLVSSLFGGAMAGMFVLLTLYQQTVLGHTALYTGLAYLPFCLAFAPGFGVAAVLQKRFGTQVTLTTAFAVCITGMLLMSRLTTDSSYTAVLLPAMIVLAVGLGMAFPAAQNAALAEVDESRSGLASGLQTTAQALGAALGVAVLVAVAASAGGPTGAEATHGYRVAFLVAAGMYLLAGILVLALVRDPRILTPDKDVSAPRAGEPSSGGPNLQRDADDAVASLGGSHER